MCCETCKENAAALDGIRRGQILTNLLLARLVDHLGLPSRDGTSAVGRMVRAYRPEIESQVETLAPEGMDDGVLGLTREFMANLDGKQEGAKND